MIQPLVMFQHAPIKDVFGMVNVKPAPVLSHSVIYVSIVNAMNAHPTHRDLAQIVETEDHHQKVVENVLAMQDSLDQATIQIYHALVATQIVMHVLLVAWQTIRIVQDVPVITLYLILLTTSVRTIVPQDGLLDALTILELYI
jgi:hypothetical protein